MEEGETVVLRGYVKRIRPDVGEVEIVLRTTDGQHLERISSAKRFVDAGLHYEDAPFNYEVRNEGGRIRSRVYYAPPTEEERSEMPDIDMSVFDL